MTFQFLTVSFIFVLGFDFGSDSCVSKFGICLLCEIRFSLKTLSYEQLLFSCYYYNLFLNSYYQSVPAVSRYNSVFVLSQSNTVCTVKSLLCVLVLYKGLDVPSSIPLINQGFSSYPEMMKELRLPLDFSPTLFTIDKIFL